MKNKVGFKFAEYDGNYFRWKDGEANVEILRGDKWEQYRGEAVRISTFGMLVDEDEIKEAMKAA